MVTGSELTVLILQRHGVSCPLRQSEQPYCQSHMKFSTTICQKSVVALVTILLVWTNLFQICVCVEHAFVALKGRFQSLHELHLHLWSHNDLEYVVHWIQCCIILHNMIIHFEETLGKELSSNWAREEACEIDRNQDPVVVEVPARIAG